MNDQISIGQIFKGFVPVKNEFSSYWAWKVINWVVWGRADNHIYTPSHKLWQGMYLQFCWTQAQSNSKLKLKVGLTLLSPQNNNDNDSNPTIPCTNFITLAIGSNFQLGAIYKCWQWSIISSAILTYQISKHIILLAKSVTMRGHNKLVSYCIKN